MRIIKPYTEIITPIDYQEILELLEKIARTCYKSEDLITDESAEKFIAGIIKRGHEAMIEHFSITVKFVCDRGVSHEIVRHRIASYAQESTRYCNYAKEKFGKEITFIEPLFWKEGAEGSGGINYDCWKTSCKWAEHYYFMLLAGGATPQEARSVLPNSLKTEIMVTFNLREWRAFFKLRTATPAHPQMRELATPLLRQFQELMPIFFNDIVGVD